MESNWAKLEPEREDGDDRGDYWLSWRSGGMTPYFTQSSFKKILMPTPQYGQSLGSTELKVRNTSRDRRNTLKSSPCLTESPREKCHQTNLLEPGEVNNILTLNRTTTKYPGCSNGTMRYPSSVKTQALSMVVRGGERRVTSPRRRPTVAHQGWMPSFARLTILAG